MFPQPDIINRELLSPSFGSYLFDQFLPKELASHLDSLRAADVVGKNEPLEAVYNVLGCYNTETRRIESDITIHVAVVTPDRQTYIGSFDIVLEVRDNQLQQYYHYMSAYRH